MDRVRVQSLRWSDLHDPTEIYDDDTVLHLLLQLAKLRRALLSPEGAACVAAYRDALQSGKVRRDERAVIFNAAIGLRADMPSKQVKLDVARPFEHAAP
jgi:threonine synthase